MCAGIYFEVLIRAARTYERGIPSEQRIKTALTRNRATLSDACLVRHSLSELENLRCEDRSADISLLYGKALKHLQMQSYRFIGDYGKLVVPFSFKKEVRNVNPFSPSLKERTKRIGILLYKTLLLTIRSLPIIR
ncbi:hypothetical protein AB6A40_010600 [Gnathostoma spinigerum]|uniref:Uncharacterized protein n=1 Tax=Gnathostoma spinigerum TaxID=75299 RepID=A0ABD6F1G2_9BILA